MLAPTLPSEPLLMYAVLALGPLPKASALRRFEVSCSAPLPDTVPLSAIASACTAKALPMVNGPALNDAP